MMLFSNASRTPWLRLLASLILLLWLVVGGSALAQPERSTDPHDVESVLADARKQIDQIRSRLDAGGEDIQFARWRNEVLDIQSRAHSVAEDLAPQLSDVTARLSQLGQAPEGTREAPDVAAQRTQLQQDSRQLDAQTKLARLLAIEAAQTAEQISTLRRTQFQAQLGERRDPILSDAFWKELSGDLPRDWRSVSDLLQEVTRGAAGTSAAVWFILAATIGMTVLLRVACGRLLLRLTTTRVPPGRLRRSFLAISVVILNSATPAIIAALLYIGVTWNATLSKDTLSLLGDLIAVTCFGGFVAGLGQALLSADRPSWRLPAIHNEIAQGLRSMPVLLGMLVVLIWLADTLPILLNASLTTTILVTSCTALLLIGALAWGLRRSDVLRKRIQQNSDDQTLVPRPTWLSVLIRVAWVALACSLISVLAGYVAFGSFVVKQVLWIMAILCAAYLLSILITDGFTTLLTPAAGNDDEPRKRLQTQAAVLLAGVGRVTVGLLAIALLLAPFGEGPSDLLHRMRQMLGGLQIGEVHLRPQALIQGLLVLALCLITVRLLKRWLADRYLPTTALDPGMQTSAATLFGYAGVVLAVAFSLSALGLGLERVAWIASALSVGIGFGLQAVVQNFVSGLILLAERPVKVGDWVSLGGVEGDILRINVRATEIQMGDRSTVIVPNSEFITKTVRNVTHDNPLGLVQVKLPMPFGTEVARAREIMLAAFMANEGILDTPAPDVFLEGVENGHLMFNARGYVSTPRNAYGVRSALLYDILQRLAEAHLPLSTPPTMLLAPRQDGLADGAMTGEDKLQPIAAPRTQPATEA